MRNFLMIFLCLFSLLFFGNLDAQASSDGLETTEIFAFVRVYLAEKEVKAGVDWDSITLRVLREYNIAPERYGQILRAQMEGKYLELKNNEISAVKALQQEAFVWNRSHEKVLEGLCVSYGITLQKYKELKSRYSSEVGFQHTVKPFFDEVIGN